MLKAAASTDQGELVLLGLSFEDLKQLREKKSLPVDLNKLGAGRVQLLIFSGKTIKDVEEELYRLIGPEAHVTYLPARWPAQHPRGKRS